MSAPTFVRPDGYLSGMAIIHEASISPTKPEILAELLGSEVTVLGAYRFDDPEGEVGIEGLVARCDRGIRHVVLSYRAAPLGDAEEGLVTTMQHSVLGERFIHHGSGDPVALACFRAALRGEQEQAVEEVWDGDTLVATREPSARLTLVPGEAASADAAVVLVEDPTAPIDVPAPHLRATWDGGEGIVAYLQ